MSNFERPLAQRLRSRLAGPRSFIQLLVGPRQVGKTTLVHQVLATFRGRSHFASADLPGLTDSSWVEQQWEVGRVLTASGEPCVLVLDEVQKVPGWSETVKRLWDEDSAAKRVLRVVLLGSSPLLLQSGSSESLAGRFEMLRVTHWTFAEMRAAFGLSLEQWLFYGGYPGAIMVAEDEERWRRYILDALIETTISRDIQLMTRIDKPALLRRVRHVVVKMGSSLLAGPGGLDPAALAQGRAQVSAAGRRPGAFEARILEALGSDQARHLRQGPAGRHSGQVLDRYPARRRGSYDGGRRGCQGCRLGSRKFIYSGQMFYLKLLERRLAARLPAGAWAATSRRRRRPAPPAGGRAPDRR